MDHVFSFNSKPKDDAFKAKSMAFMKISEINMRLEEKLGLTLSALLSLFSQQQSWGTLHSHDAHTHCTLMMYTHFAHSWCMHTLHSHDVHTLHSHDAHTLCIVTMHMHFAVTMHTHFAYSCCPHTLHIHDVHTLCIFMMYAHFAQSQCTHTSFVIKLSKATLLPPPPLFPNSLLLLNHFLKIYFKEGIITS